MMIIPSEKPSSGVPQIVIMGTGYGECILVHLGNDKYVMIDSFLNPETKHPIAADYLNCIGLGIQNIIGIICTHWDDDHIKGIYEIASNLKGIAIGIPTTVSNRELKKLREYLMYTKGFQNYVPMDEFSKLLELDSRKLVELNHCLPQRQLFGKQIKNENLSEISVEALSPSDNQFREFINQLALPKDGDLMQGVNFSNNRISVVSIFKLNKAYCLFGGDLENMNSEWDKIIENYNYPKADIFKVPHHGSKTGYSENVWNNIVDNPFSIITRFNRGKVSLPQNEQIELIHEKSRKVFIIGGKNKRARGDEMKILEGLKYSKNQQIVKRSEKLGIVRLTYCISGWTYEAFGEVEAIEKKK